MKQGATDLSAEYMKNILGFCVPVILVVALPWANPEVIPVTWPPVFLGMILSITGRFRLTPGVDKEMALFFVAGAVISFGFMGPEVHTVFTDVR